MPPPAAEAVGRPVDARRSPPAAAIIAGSRARDSRPTGKPVLGSRPPAARAKGGDDVMSHCITRLHEPRQSERVRGRTGRAALRAQLLADALRPPVFGSTLAAMACQMGSRSFQESGWPPGISDGPKRARTSHPLTPEPKKRQRSAY